VGVPFLQQFVNVVFDILSLIGALGLFIYGMKVMSEAIQKFAGARLRKTLRAMTATKSWGVLTGLGVTGLLQSSSATTVMTISFVNAGLITLEHSIGLIMGANLGTTVTAWIVAVLGMGKLSISQLSLPILGFAFPMLFLGKDRAKLYGEAILGFALLFLGLAFMRETMPAWQENTQILNFLQQFKYGEGAYLENLGVGLLFVLLGMVATFLLQSSSAAMALTLVFTANGLISFPLAAAIILGENIGTTFTANIAAVVANVHAKRAARAHFVFNVFGVIWALLLLPFFLDLIAFASQYLFNGDPFTNSAVIPLSLSLFHTLFNFFNVLLFFNLVHWLAAIAKWMVPSRGTEDELYSLDFIGSNLMATPELSMIEARKELVKFADLIRKAYKFIPLLITEMEEKKLFGYVKKLEEYEEISDRMEVEISNYLSKISRSDLSDDGTSRVRSMLQVANNLERIGDIYLEVSRNLANRKEQKAYFTPGMRNSVMQLSNLVSRSLDLMVKNIDGDDHINFSEESKKVSRDVAELYQALKMDYIQKIEQGKFRIQSGMYYADLLAEMERIAEHASSVSEAIGREKLT
jgi:phosphate:Na+ symporter